MILIDDNTNVNLDTLAEQHYDNLVGPLLANGINYHATASLVQRIRNRRTIDAAIPNLTRVAFWDYLLNNNFTNLKRIIVSRPDVLKTIIADIYNITGAGLFSNDIDYDNATLTEFGGIVKKIFNYKLYRSKQECRDNCNQFNLSYCPYCNEQTTQVITEIDNLTWNAERLALLQLDHFYPQSRHPYFAVSFFNLIPGCSPCNAQLKLEKRFDIDTHFNPFQKRFDDTFNFEVKDLTANTEADIEFEYRNKMPYSNNSIVDFKIMTRYNNVAHRRVALKMLNTFKFHSSKINKSLGQQIIGLFTINESKTRLLLEKYNVPLHQREISHVHLGKLKRDIANQLNILNNP